MSSANVNAHNATPFNISPPLDDLLPPFTTRQYSHLPTPQSPNTLGRYLNEHPPSPETPVHQNASSSVFPPTTPSDKQRNPSWKSVSDGKFTRFPSTAQQYATPESSPLFQHISNLPPSNSATPRYSLHSSTLEFSTPKQSLSAQLESVPASGSSKGSSTLSSPFMGRMSLDEHTTKGPAEVDEDVFSIPKHHSQASSVINALSTPPVSPQPRDSNPTSVIQAGGEMERIRQALLEETLNRIREAESRRPDYLKRAKRTPPEMDSTYFDEDPNDRERWPPIGVMDSPQKGRRLKLFQETSDESFEESLMAGGYGRYRTADWVRQPQPISLPSSVGGSSVVVSLLEEVEEAPPTEKQLKKKKRLAAFRSEPQPGNSKICPVEVEGKGRVLMEVSSLPGEQVTPGSPEPTPSKRKGTNRRKKKPGVGSPDKKTKLLGNLEVQPDKPNWPDSEFPWRLRTEERIEEAKAEQEERLRWIERYLDRDSDSDYDEQIPLHVEQPDSAILYDRGSRTSYQAKMGQGKMIPLSVASDDPWNLIPKRPFPVDPADAREALLSKKSVRTLSYRQQRRQRQEEDEDDEVLCICRGRDDGRELVQCDSCQTWYHLRCIGIKNIAALGREEDPWFCGRCHAARSRSPSIDIYDEIPTSEPTFVPTEPLSSSRRSSDTTLFQSNIPESPNWSTTRMPRTPTRGTTIHNLSDASRASWHWGDPSRLMPSTPRQHHLAPKTPNPLDSHNPNFYDESSPFDPASTPSRGIKFHVPFATPKATSAWPPPRSMNPLFQTPSRTVYHNRGGVGGTTKIHVPHSASLDENSLSAGSSIHQYSFARVLASDESPIRRNKSSDATFGRRRLLSPVRPLS